MTTTTVSTTPALDLPAARQLRDGLTALLRAERTAAADFLLALSDFDRRRGWELLGHASLFAFLVVELRLSKGAAYVRSSAARLLQAFPRAIDPLRDGRLCLSSVGELARVATADNFEVVLPRFFGCSAREAREVAAGIIPHESPPRRDQVTRLAPAPGHRTPALPLIPERSVPPSPSAAAAALQLQPVDSESVRAHEPDVTHPARDRAAPRDDVEPLTADLRRLHVTVTQLFLKKLNTARDGLSHAIPGATSEQVLEAALDLLLEKQARRRGLVKRRRKATPDASSAATPTPTPTPTSTSASPTLTPETLTAPLHRREGPRETVPADVKRAVWARDQGHCVWPLDSGGVCGSTHQVEVDHSAVPWARGGEATLANLRLLCHAHDKLAATLAFGARCMQRYAAASPRPSRPEA